MYMQIYIDIYQGVAYAEDERAESWSEPCIELRVEDLLRLEALAPSAASSLAAFCSPTFTAACSSSSSSSSSTSSSTTLLRSNIGRSNS